MAQAAVYLRVACAVVTFSLTTTGYSAMTGEEVYQGTCIACHGSDGKGTMPGIPELGGQKGLLNKSDAELRKNIFYGFRSPGSYLSMPPKGGNPRLTREDIEAVIRYMREAFGNH